MSDIFHCKSGVSFNQACHSSNIIIGMNRQQKTDNLLSYQPRVTVTSCFVYTIIRDLESIDPLCINPNRRIGLIRK